MQLDGARTVVFAGDSVTDCGWRDDGTGLGGGYVRRVAEVLAAGPRPAPRVLNRGTGGDRLVDLERRWDTDVLAARPDVVSVLVGVNDSWRQHDRGMPSPVAEFEARYDGLLAAAATAGARPVLVEPFVVPVDDDQRTWSEDLDARCGAVRRLAARWSGVLVPARDEMRRRAADVGAAALAADGVHPTPLGHRVLADLWLAAVLPELAPGR